MSRDIENLKGKIIKKKFVLVPELFSSWKTLPFIDCIEQAPGIIRKLKKSEIKSDGDGLANA